MNSYFIGLYCETTRTLQFRHLNVYRRPSVSVSVVRVSRFFYSRQPIVVNIETTGQQPDVQQQQRQQLVQHYKQQTTTRS